MVTTIPIVKNKVGGWLAGWLAGLIGNKVNSAQSMAVAELDNKLVLSWEFSVAI